MTSRRLRPLSAKSRTSDLVDDEDFAVVTGDGEIYTSFTIVRITHEATDRTMAFTHVAEVTRKSDQAFGVAELRIVNRVIDDARITMIVDDT